MSGKKHGPADARPVDWALALGEERRVRDIDTARMAKSQEDDETRMNASLAGRWAAIVEGIRQLADVYNAGARRVVLKVDEQFDTQTMTVTADCEGTPSLTAALEGKLICVQARDAGGAPYVSEIRLRPDRNDNATAAYIVQHWMQGL